MAVRLRLSRHGTTNAPFYWMVASDSRFARDGRYLEKLGFYNPLLVEGNPERLKLNKERIQYWLSVGACPSDRALKLLQLISMPGLDKFIASKENKSTTGNPRTTKHPDKLRRNKKVETPEVKQEEAQAEAKADAAAVATEAMEAMEAMEAVETVTAIIEAPSTTGPQAESTPPATEAAPEDSSGKEA